LLAGLKTRKSLDDCSLIEIVWRNADNYLMPWKDASEFQTQHSRDSSQHPSSTGQLHTEAGFGKFLYDEGLVF